MQATVVSVAGGPSPAAKRGGDGVSSNYWSSTTNANNTNNAWHVNFTPLDRFAEIKWNTFTFCRAKKTTIFYVGCTNDLRNRLRLHNNGSVASTSKRRPLRLVYYEASINKSDSIRRERYLKTSWGNVT